MSIKELKILIYILQDKMGNMPIDSPRFKAALIVNRRLMRLLKDSVRHLKNAA